jgi:hypothetical protein
MPSDFIIDDQRAVVFSRGTGVFTYAEFLDHMARLSADPRFRPEFDQLVDCRALTSLEFTSDQTSELAKGSIFSGRSRRAFVVSSDLQFGMSRMFATYREIGGAKEIMIFREMREALSWLNLPPDFDLYAAGGPKQDVQNA